MLAMFCCFERTASDTPLLLLLLLLSVHQMGSKHGNAVYLSTCMLLKLPLLYLQFCCLLPPQTSSSYSMQSVVLHCGPLCRAACAFYWFRMQLSLFVPMSAERSIVCTYTWTSSRFGTGPCTQRPIISLFILSIKYFLYFWYTIIHLVCAKGQ